MPTAGPARRVALIEAFFSGSHKRWAEELQRRSRHEIDLFTLPGRHWKWRMHGGAVSLASQVLEARRHYDCLIATDMLDLSTFLSLARRKYAGTPTALYMHENQLCYPWSPRDKDKKRQRDLHYAFINYASCLAADQVFFNSDYHRRAYLGKLPGFLEAYPDHRNAATAALVEQKSSILPLALDLASLDAHRPQTPLTRKKPLLIWNHRWEYDKNPKGFCRILLALAQDGLDFEVALLGDRFAEEPPYFAQAREKLGSRIVAYGRAERFSDYAQWLWSADIAPVSSAQDFFGGSVVEAIHCGCHPILPLRLAYPEHVDPAAHPERFYQSEEEAVRKTARLIASGSWSKPCPLAATMARYDWRASIDRYDEAIARLCSG